LDVKRYETAYDASKAKPGPSMPEESDLEKLMKAATFILAYPVRSGLGDMFAYMAAQDESFLWPMKNKMTDKNLVPDTDG
jgi:hypothetical protein